MKKLYITLLFCFTGAFAFAQNPAPCSDLFFSEYIEGTSFNKVIEIYNPTPAAINLADYKLLLFANGSPSATSTFTLYGTLAAGGVYILTNPNDTSVYINSIADTTAGTINFTGNDAFALMNIISLDTIDRIGQIGVDSLWVVGAGSTADHSLVRNMSVNHGQNDWGIGATEWDVFALNDFSNLGSHTMTPCAVTTDPTVFLVHTAESFGEPSITVQIEVGINNPNATATTVELSVADISAIAGSDYSLAGSPVTVTFPPNSSAIQTVDIVINNDAILESNETFSVNLANPTNGASISLAQEIVTILDDDGNNPIQIRFLHLTDSVNENIGLFSSQLELFAGAGTSAPTSIDVKLISALSSATSGGVDFSFSDTTITWPAGDASSKFAIFNVNDDAIDESLEYFVLYISNPTNNALMGVIDTTYIYIKDNDPSSVQNIFNDGSVKLIPNPANAQVMLWANDFFDSYQIMDATGRVVMSGAIENDKQKVLDVSALANGIYFVQVKNENSVQTLKFMKQ